MRVVEPVTHYGFYSPSQAMENGFAVYQTPSGAHVHVTCVTTDPEGSSYWFTDKEKVGEVTKFVTEQRPQRWPWN